MNKRKSGATEQIPWKIEELKVFKETPREEMCRIFKKHKILVSTQAKKLSKFGANTVNSELRRMTEFDILSAKTETVQLGDDTRVKQMIVYRWLNQKNAERSRRSYDR